LFGEAFDSILGWGDVVLSFGSVPVLELLNITKEFYGNRVLKGVSLSVMPGEVLGIVGENGAGKSTLMNIVFGMPVIASTGGYSGEIRFEGRTVRISSPREAASLGIGMVHQEFMLLPGFSVAENIKLNREPTRPNFLSRLLGERLETLDLKRMGEDSRKALDELGMDLDEWLPVAGLPVGYMQFVEIAREIDKTNVKLLVFDEPTAVLSETEAERLLEAIRVISSKGVAVLFITHRLHETLAVSDRVVVLRDGEKVAELRASEASVGQLAEMMVGRKLERSLRRGRGPGSAGEPFLVVRDLHVDMPGERVRGLSFQVRRGEIFGIGGLAGQGKIGIANGLMGLYPARGEVYKGGKRLELGKPELAIRSGMAFVSEDRRRVGLMLDESIEFNIAATAVQVKGKFLKDLFGGLLKMVDWSAIREHALRCIKDLDIRCTGPDQTVRKLSGGNQQKVCIARALTLEPDLLLVSEPTRGIDVGAKKLVLETLVRLNEEMGMTILMTSSELAELRLVCDRIGVVCEGKMTAILPPDADDRLFGLAMAGEKIQAA